MATESEYRPRELDYVREGFWRGRRYFLCATGTAPADGLALIGEDMPNMPTGEEPPVGARFKVLRHVEGKKTFDLLVVEYATSLIGKGLVYVDETMRNVRVVRDTTDVGVTYPVIEGPEIWEMPGTATPPNRKDRYEWEVTTGSNVVAESHYGLTIKTAYTAAGLDAIVPKLMALNGRSVNDTAFTEFFSGDSGTAGRMLWRGHRRQYDRADEYTVIFRLAYNKDGWAGSCKSTGGVWTPIKVPVVDAAGVPVDPADTRAAGSFNPGYEKNDAGNLVAWSDVSHNLYVAGDMSFIDDLVRVG